MSFDSSPELIADLIDDPEQLAKAVLSLRPGGGTALYEAIYFSCRDKLQLDQPRHKFRGAIIVVSDGDDNQTRLARSGALRWLKRLML